MMKSRILSVCFVMMVFLAGISTAALLVDNFEDGNFNANPQWNVITDTWQVVQETGGNHYLRMQEAGDKANGQIYASYDPITGGKFEVMMRLKPENTGLSSNNYSLIYAGDKSSWTATTNYNNSYFVQIMQRNSGNEVQIKKWDPTGTNRPILAQKAAYIFGSNWVDMKFTYDSSLASGNLKLYIGDMLNPYLTATDSSLTTFDSVVLVTRDSDNYRWGFDDVAVVPEPATMVLLGLGGLLLRRKKA